MTLADDMPPTDCIATVAKRLGTHSSIILGNLPGWGDSPRVRIEKWSIIEQALLEIKDYAKEGLKARLMGSQSAVNALDDGSVQSTLGSEGETRCTVTGPDGVEHETSIAQMEAVTEGIKRKDPKIMKKLKELDAEERA